MCMCASLGVINWWRRGEHGGRKSLFQTTLVGWVFFPFCAVFINVCIINWYLILAVLVVFLPCKKMAKIIFTCLFLPHHHTYREFHDCWLLALLLILCVSVFSCTFNSYCWNNSTPLLDDLFLNFRWPSKMFRERFASLLISKSLISTWQVQV